MRRRNKQMLKRYKQFKIGLQFFAEGDPPANPPTPTPAPAAGAPQGKVWTDEYVQGLREENKTRRLSEKTANTRIRTLLGLKEDDEIDDAKITAFQTTQTQKITAAEQKANAKLILAEIKSLDGYNPKLVSALIDKSKLTISDDGTITGLKEAVEALAVEYPEIKKTSGTPPAAGGANPPPAGTQTDLDKLKADHAAAVKSGNLAEQISLKNKIFAIENKK